MDRINLILDEEAEIVEIDQAITDNIRGNIEFKNVSFKYPSSDYYALSNINFTLRKGETLAILGRTGSGKSTIADLLLRMYDIEEGSILIDNHNIKDFQLKTLRESIGYVPQDNFLFSQTIKENIAFAFDNEPEDEKVIKAAKMAEVYNNIIDFPESFNTVLGERGVTLSGGQRQRSSIARALIKEPSILILDDSLSAVDTETEENILNNLDSIKSKTTTIIISHRVSTIQDADEIIFLDNGQIVERGKHEELLQLNGFYKDLYEKQLLEEKIQ